MSGKTCKLSDLKVGDRFTVAGTVEATHNLGVDFRLDGVPSGRIGGVNRLNFENSECVTVTKIDPPPRELVKGERIQSKAGNTPGEYLGRGWVWWDSLDYPTTTMPNPTTEFYDVIDQVP